MKKQRKNKERTKKTTATTTTTAPTFQPIETYESLARLRTDNPQLFKRVTSQAAQNSLDVYLQQRRRMLEKASGAARSV